LAFPISRVQLIFWLDVILLILTAALETVPFTGLTLHEWLGMAISLLILIHILLSWTWIAASSRRLTAPRAGRTRVNYLLNFCLFASVSAVIVSGLFISEVALPAPGIKTVAGDFGWGNIHGHFSDFVFIFVGLHLAINWDWSIAAARKCLGIRVLPE
jgi:cytochrome b